jgi:hypothetical protein
MSHRGNAPGNTAMLKFGAGKDLDQGTSDQEVTRAYQTRLHYGTMYSPSSGMISGPSSKMMVPARYMFANIPRVCGSAVTTSREMRTLITCN